ncbi:hypothetical protein pb186bvf_015514 [Paramecium bursaria]
MESQFIKEDSQYHYRHTLSQALIWVSHSNLHVEIIYRYQFYSNQRPNQHMNADNNR